MSIPVTNINSEDIGNVKATSLVYSNFGVPSEVLTLVNNKEIDEPQAGEILVRVLAAPINPVDILTIQNTYPITPTEFPATGGSECVGEVLRIGPNVSEFVEGDRVIIPFPAPTHIGTWTSHANYPQKSVMKFPNNIAIPEAATFSLNPVTAYAMLKEFVHLEQGDTIIQNAANSAVGQMVHQLCKAWKINSVGIVRKRSDSKKYEDVKEYLKKLGATEILSPDELKTTDLFESKLKKPKLALNAVGGKTTELMANYLQKKGVLVTYGALTKSLVSGESYNFMINDISFKGFWITEWLKGKIGESEKIDMYNELIRMVTNGELLAPVHEMIKIEDYKNAVSLVLKGYTGKNSF